MALTGRCDGTTIGVPSHDPQGAYARASPHVCGLAHFVLPAGGLAGKRSLIGSTWICRSGHGYRSAAGGRNHWRPWQHLQVDMVLLAARPDGHAIDNAKA